METLCPAGSEVKAFLLKVYCCVSQMEHFQAQFLFKPPCSFFPKKKDTKQPKLKRAELQESYLECFQWWF